MKGWLVTLADGRRYSWSEEDGVLTERGAILQMLATDPDAQIESVQEETVLVVVPLSEN